MKKIFSLLLISLTILFHLNNTTIYATQETSTIDSFTNLPANWELYADSDVGGTTTKYENNEMIITNSGSGVNTSYYGSVYNVQIDKAYTDFTFELTAKMTNPYDSGRWLGIGYHTQYMGGKMIGYLMNYRSSGHSAYSAFNSGLQFNDGETINTNIPLNDDNYHTFKIVMQGTTSSHYIDDVLIETWDVTSRDSHLGRKLTSGGFAIFVNRSTVHIKSVKISGEVVENNPNELPKDETLVDTYFKPGVLNFPTVILDLKNIDQLTMIPTSSVNPSNVILHIDDSLNVIGENKEVLGNFTEIYQQLDKKIIPIVYLKNDEQADALINYLSNELFILDMAIMSQDLSLIKKVKDIHSSVRGIIEYADNTDLNEMVHEANKNFATVIVLNQSYATQETIRYLHARFKTVWVKPKSESKIDLHNAICSETYGLIVDDFKNLYSLYNTYDPNALSRTPFNVAHRGLSSMYNENSVYGIKKAIETGATHLEIDAYLTKDGKVAIMHDSTIDRTSNGQGNVENMTLEQLQQYQLDLMSPFEKIPSLMDMLEVIKKTNVILVLEIKSAKPQIVKAIKNELTAAGMLDNTVVISFNTTIILEMKKVLPEIPTALLGTNLTNAASLYTYGSLNTISDTNNSAITKITNMTYYRDRGMTSWAWTYAAESNVQSAWTDGIVGITNNVCNYFCDKSLCFEGESFTLANNEKIEDAIFTVKATTYTGKVNEVDAQLFYYEEYDTYYEVICSVEVESTPYKKSIFYTESFKVEKSGAPVTPNEPTEPTVPNNPTIPSNPPSPDNNAKKGCFGGINMTYTLIILLGFSGFLLMLKKANMKKIFH